MSKYVYTLSQIVGMPYPVLMRTFCKQCGADVTNAPRCFGAYSCKQCDCWTTFVEAKAVPAFIVNVT